MIKIFKLLQIPYGDDLLILIQDPTGSLENPNTIKEARKQNQQVFFHPVYHFVKYPSPLPEGAKKRGTGIKFNSLGNSPLT